jgi:hypothetical protein
MADEQAEQHTYEFMTEAVTIRAYVVTTTEPLSVEDVRARLEELATGDRCVGIDEMGEEVIAESFADLGALNG